MFFKSFVTIQFSFLKVVTTNQIWVRVERFIKWVVCDPCSMVIFQPLDVYYYPSNLLVEFGNTLYKIFDKIIRSCNLKNNKLLFAFFTFVLCNELLNIERKNKSFILYVKQTKGNEEIFKEIISKISLFKAFLLLISFQTAVRQAFNGL